MIMMMIIKLRFRKHKKAAPDHTPAAQMIDCGRICAHNIISDLN